MYVDVYPDTITMEFKKTIDRFVVMTNGHLRVFFDDESELELLINKKRGPVLPRRKRVYARKIGVI